MDKDFEPTTVEQGTGLLPAPTHAHAGARSLWGGLRRLLGRGALRWRDGQTALLSRHGLIERGETRLLESRHVGAALAVFDFRDLLELRGIYGDAVASDVQQRLVAKLQRLAGRTGLAARTGPAQFAVLLPGLDREQAIDAAHRVLGCPCRIEHELPDDDLVLVPEVVVDVCVAAPGAVRTLYGRLSVTLARHRDAEERRRLHLRRERERLVRPAYS